MIRKQMNVLEPHLKSFRKNMLSILVRRNIQEIEYSMNRRQFLFGSAMFITGCSDVVRTQPKQAVNNFSIIDTHQHLWNLSQFRLPWLKPGGELTRDFTLEDYVSQEES